MEQTAQELLEVLEGQLPALREITEEEAGFKPDLKWSKKEILGHLIDSACNNQQKFVRTMQSDGHIDFVGYDQDFWVKAQYYQQRNWSDLLQFWEHYNRHIASIMGRVSEADLLNTISIDSGSPLTLSDLMTDYVKHLKHHLRQILPSTNHTMS